MKINARQAQENVKAFEEKRFEKRKEKAEEILSEIAKEIDIASNDGKHSIIYYHKPNELYFIAKSLVLSALTEAQFKVETDYSHFYWVIRW